MTYAFTHHNRVCVHRTKTISESASSLQLLFVLNLSLPRLQISLGLVISNWIPLQLFLKLFNFQVHPSWAKPSLYKRHRLRRTRMPPRMLYFLLGSINYPRTTTTTVGPTRLYVGGLHHSITDQDVKDIFSQFGSIEFISLQKTQDGSSKGFAYVQYGNFFAPI